jgi:thymidine kinase
MSLEIVVGPMFSGKSSFALSYIRRQHAIGKKVLVIKPDIDNRYSDENSLITHDQERTPCISWPVNQELSLTEQMRTADCIVFEEAQFFRGLSNVATYILRAYKKNILIVGLDGDARQERFGEILDCIPWATSVKKLNALCSACKNGTLGPYSKKINDNPQQIEVGGSEKYAAVCLKHLTDVG